MPDEIVSSLFAGQNRPTRFCGERSGSLANAVARQAFLGQRIGHFDTIAGRKDRPTRPTKVERFFSWRDLHQRGGTDLQPRQLKGPDPRRKGFGRSRGPGQKQHGFDVLRHGAPSIVPNSLR